MITLNEYAKQARDFALFMDYDDERRQWLVCYSHYRDSDLLNDHNWNVFVGSLESVANRYDWEIIRFDSDLVGWVEHFLIRPGSEAQSICQELLDRLEDYPILDEDEYYQRRDDEAGKYWQDMSLRDRIDMLARNGENIFAARNDELPWNTDNYSQTVEELERIVEE